MAKKAETNMELEHWREIARQCSSAASLNEVYQTQLHSMQQERFQYNKERIHLEENIDKLKTDVHNVKAKCKQLGEEKLLDNTVITKLEERLKRSECDKQFCQQQMHEVIARLATCEYEIQVSNDSIKESNIELSLLRTERDKFKEACERLNIDSEIRGVLQIKLHHAQETNREIVERLNGNEMRLEISDDEMIDPFETLKCNTEKTTAVMEILNLQKELETEKIQRKELEDKLTNAAEQLEHLHRQPEGIIILSFTQGGLFFQIVCRLSIRIWSNLNCSIIADMIHVYYSKYTFRNSRLIRLLRYTETMMNRNLCLNYKLF